MNHENHELISGEDELGLISDINVIPFIDIMLVLLIIFMVTAPLMLGGVHINLPKSGGEPMARPINPLIVSMDSATKIFIDKEEVAKDSKHERFKQLALNSEDGEVFVRGDGQVKYAEMMELMADLGQAGFARVTLVTDVKSGAKKRQENTEKLAKELDSKVNTVSFGAEQISGSKLNPISTDKKEQ